MGPHAGTTPCGVQRLAGSMGDAARCARNMPERKCQHSIRINDQWRICLAWKTDGAHRVEIVDYH